LNSPYSCAASVFVGRHDNGRALHFLNHIGDGEGLARAGHPQQGLVRQARLHSLGQLGNGRGLITSRLEAGLQVELTHHYRTSQGNNKRT
tara:strand:+ start:161 stop:430 length:270 start_codon:yes stop_codon:yes gene_type:complete